MADGQFAPSGAVAIDKSRDVMGKFAGIPSWSPYRVGVTQAELLHHEHPENIVGGRLLPHEYRAKPTHRELNEQLGRINGTDGKGIKLGWDKSDTAEGARLRDFGAGMPMWSPLFSLTDPPPREDAVAARMTRAQPSGVPVARRPMSATVTRGPPLAGAPALNLARAAADGDAPSAVSRDDGAVVSEPDLQKAMKRWAIMKATQNLPTKSRLTYGAPGAGEAPAAVQFMGRSRVNERMKKRPPKYPAKAADIARMRGEPPNARGAVRRPASASASGKPAPAKAAPAPPPAVPVAAAPASTAPAAPAPEPEVDDRVFSFATKKLSEQEIRDRGFGIPKWSPYHRNSQKVNPGAFQTMAQEYGSYSDPEKVGRPAIGKGLLTPRTQSLAARRNVADMRGQACVDHTWELFGTRPRAVLMDHVGKMQYPNAPVPYSEADTQKKTNPFTRAM